MRFLRVPQLGVLAVSGRRCRRVVSVGAVRGVLTLSERGWVVANDAEVRLLEGVAR